MAESKVDRIYVAASARDARFTRTCVASIRRLYREVRVDLLVGGPLQAGLAKEVAERWNVGVADVPMRDWGWGFVKLEPLFRPPGERFLVLDSDTVMTGPVLELLDGRDADLVVDAEQQDERRTREIYYDWIASRAEGAPLDPPSFVFNTGQWFARSGVIQRQDFAGLVDWSGPKPLLVNPRVFKNGDQGVLNLVANRLVREGRLTVDRVPLLCWPGAGMGTICAQSVADGTAPTRVVHWAGIKGARHGQFVGGDVLRYFEEQYYGPTPAGVAKRQLASARHAINFAAHTLTTRARLHLGRFAGRVGD
jgi:hypothetical protein